MQSTTYSVRMERLQPFSTLRKNNKTNKQLKEGSGEGEEPAITLTDAEATKMCMDWKTKYNVVVGASWGDLPYDLQQKWLSNSCDYHMKDDVV